MPSAVLDTTFAALADPTRRAILAQLARGEATVGELAHPFAISLPAVSRHLKVLEQATLITRRRDGQHLRCRLNAAPLATASAWLEFYRNFWSESLDRLAAHLRTTHPPTPMPRKKAHAQSRRPRRQR